MQIQKWKCVTAKSMQSVPTNDVPGKYKHGTYKYKYRNENVSQANQCKVCRTNDVPGRRQKVLPRKVHLSSGLLPGKENKESEEF